MIAFFKKSLLLALCTGIASAANSWAVSPAPYQIQPYNSTQYQDLNLARDGGKTDLQPKEIYGSAPSIGIRIANGGAGYTGLLRALSEAYLAKHHTIKGQPFSIAWYATNTTYSYHALRDHVVDIALIYEVWPQALTGKNAYGQKLTALFNDAFLFIGPLNNPAKLVPANSTKTGDNFDAMLDKIIATGCQKPFGPDCSMYLSRSDLSGTYKKETTYLIAHRTPVDLVLNSPWYYPKPSTPRDALKEAGEKGLYAMNDKSTWVSQPELQKGLKIYADGSLGFDINLLNPCYGLLAKPNYLQSNEPLQFLHWMAGPEGQGIITNYGKKEFGAPVVKPR